MSKPVKNLITETYTSRFSELDSAVIIDLRGVPANENNALRHELNQKAIRVSVIKNRLAKKAFAGTGLDPINELLKGSCALVYGGESVVDIARSLLQQAKEIDNLEFRGALMEGELYGPDQIQALSDLPTREEAQATTVQIILSPGGNLVGSILGPGRMIAGLVGAIEKKLEDGETINAAEVA